MRVIISCIFIFLFVHIYATEQTGDNLIYKSDTIQIYDYPLDSLIKVYPPFGERINKYAIIICISSGCWRGYIATWKIENDSLFLSKLINGCEDFTFKLNRLFKVRKITNRGVFADWFSGEIRAKTDFKKAIINKYEMSVPTKLLIIKIKEGKIIELSTEDIHYDESYLIAT